MRKPRSAIVVPDFPHHITLRGNNRRRLFTFKPDFELFLELLAQTLATGGIELHALTLMKNHVHMIATPASADVLAKRIACVSQRFAQRRNRALGASGKLFEERYDAAPILTEAHLSAAFPYLDLNAKRAGVNRAVDRYRWSTYAHYAGRGRSEIPAHMLTVLPWYDSLGRDVAARRKAYAQLVEDRWAAYERESRGTTKPVVPAPALRRPNRTRCA